MELSLATPALLFPAVSMLMLAYTNRFLALASLIRELHARHQAEASVLLVEQNFHFAATVADRHYVMEHGRIVDQFSTPELKANMGKLHEYLGV